MDSGKYECSVNTMPKIKHVVELLVEDPRSRRSAEDLLQHTRFSDDEATVTHSRILELSSI